MNFKKGDKVRRISGSFNGMEIGDIGTVVCYIVGTGLSIKEYGEGHASHYFRLVKRGGKTMTLKDKFVLVSDSETIMETTNIFDSKKEAMEWVEENKRDPILCKLVPISRVKFKAVEEKL